MLTDFPADLAAAQIDAEYIYPISTGAYWGRLMTVLPTASYGVADTPPSSSSPRTPGWPPTSGPSR